MKFNKENFMQDFRDWFDDLMYMEVKYEDKDSITFNGVFEFYAFNDIKWDKGHDGIIPDDIINKNYIREIEIELGLFKEDFEKEHKTLVINWDNIEYDYPDLAYEVIDNGSKGPKSFKLSDDPILSVYINIYINRRV